MKFLICTLVVVFTFCSNCTILCFSHQNGGSESWFEDIDFEEYKPAAGHYYGRRSSNELKFLQVPCGIILMNNSDDDQTQQRPSRVYPLPTRLDTNLVQTRISQKALKANANLSNLVIKKGRRYIIPEGSLLLRLESTTVPSPEMDVVIAMDHEDDDDDESFDLFLGMDFLSTYQAIINIREGELHIIVDKEEVMIPLLQPRDDLLKEDL
eukprot:scaffold792_cov84-Cylindrotheca_fusiformis.AAC.12